MKKRSNVEQVKQGFKDGFKEILEEDAPAITSYAKQIKDIVGSKKK